MGAWRQKPAGWPLSAPSPTDAGWSGWAQHWVASLSPLWLTRTAIEHDLALRVAARRTWRHLAAETAALERATGAGGGLRQALLDAAVPPEAVAEILRAVDADVAARQTRLRELRQIGEHL